MKQLLAILIFVQSGSLIGQNPGLSTTKKNFIISALESAIENNKPEYLRHLIDKSTMKTMVLKGRNIPPEAMEQVDSIINVSYDEYIEEQSSRFKSIQLKVKEFKLVWADVVVDSITSKKDPDEPSMLSGTIFFRKKDNSEFYKANYDGLMQFQDKTFIETLFVPYVYIGPKNRLLTASIKQRYLDTCVSHAKYLISRNPDNSLKALYGNCLPCHCEKQYFSDTEQTDGVSRIKKAIVASRPFSKPKAK